jgi:hypothetical protein
MRYCSPSYVPHAPPISSFLMLNSSTEYIQVWGPLSHFVNYFLWWVVSPSPNSQTGGPPLVDCPWLPIQYIGSYPSYT